MSSDDIAIRVHQLGKRYQVYDTPRDRLKQFVLPRLHRLAGAAPKHYFSEFWALDDVSFEVKKGETVGIIGRNGSGKSTLLQMICGTLSPTNGHVELNGRVAALLELGAGFNPEFTGRENIFMNGTLLGLSTQEIEARYDDIVAFADVGMFIDQPVKMYSSGMFVRVAFAIAASMDPSILIVDEALAVGDLAFQAKCMVRLRELMDAGTTVLFVSHDMSSVRNICSKVLWLKQGHAVAFGDPKEVVGAYVSEMNLDINRITGGGQ
jgi:lipopolysaccharide transport system ATP-binding protein